MRLAGLGISAGIYESGLFVVLDHFLSNCAIAEGWATR
jgi:hypothetical protein